MTLTTFSNRNRKEFKETYLWSMKKSRGMMALLALLMFIAFPMILMIGMANAQHNTDTVMTAEMWIDAYIRYISLISVFVMPLILLFVMVIAVLQFSYLHQKRSVDLFHALPVGRVPMLLGRYCAGLATIFVPIIVNFAIVSIIGLSYHIAAQHSLTAVAVQMLWMMLMSTAALTFSVFMAICTGTTFDMVISILGISVAYPLLIFVSSSCASRLLPGLNIELSANSTVLTALSPFAAAFLPFTSVDRHWRDAQSLPSVSGIFLVWWIVLTLVMLAATLLLYRKRKSESAENNFAFPIPKVVIRFIITAVAGIGFGLLLQMSTSTPSNFFVGIVTGSLAAHIVVEAVYSRGFQQMKKSFAYYGIFVIAFLLFYGTLATGFFGYDTRLPSADQVVSISVTTPQDSPYSNNDYIYTERYSEIITKIIPTLQDKENINKILELHKNSTATIHNTSYPYSIKSTHYSNFTLTYHLKDGRTMKRTYPYDNSGKEMNQTQSSLDGMVNQITQMKEFRETNSILFHLDSEYIKSIDIRSNQHESKENTIVPDIAAKEELLEALKQDYVAGGLSENSSSNDEEKDWQQISISFENPVLLKDGKLKTFLGGLNGKITLSGNTYTLTSSAERTKAIIKKYGWDK